MRKLNIYFSPLYIITSFVIIYLGGLNTFCYYFVALILHELSHIFVAKRLGYMLNDLSFMPYGAKLNGEINYKNNMHEILVSFAGPLFNLFLALMLTSFWWIRPVLYAYTKDFVEANFCMGIFNLLPLFPLDGGQAFLKIFGSIKSKKIAYKVMQIWGVICSLIFVLLFICSAFNNINFSLIFIALFLFISSITPYRVDYKNSIENFKTNINNFCECKTFVVEENVNFLKLTKNFNSHYFCYFVFVNKNFVAIKTLSQVEILECIGNGKYFLK